jgi:hypothetical protein
MGYRGGVDKLVLFHILVLRLEIEMEGGIPYRNLLLRQYNRTVLSSDTNRHDIRSSDGLEGIFYPPTTR